MDGAARILRRYTGASVLIAVFLLIVNYVILGTFVFKGMNEGYPPVHVTQSVAEGLHKIGDHYVLDAKAQDWLRKSQAWAMLIANNGQVIWNEALPEQLPRTYSLAEVAQLSRNYLQDYPVFVWEHEMGLIVVGYPKDSLAKYQFHFPISWISDLPFRLLALVIGNILLAALLSLLIGSRLIRAIRPLISGIHALAEEQQTQVEAKGMLSGIARSINHASKLLQEKNDLLKARDEARSNWIAGISHDIRTPLSMVLGYASELEESEEVPYEQQQKASIIRKQGEKLRSLVSDLNLVSMLEYEMQPLHTKTIRTSTLARRIVSDFLNNGLPEAYTIELDVTTEQCFVMGDEKLLTRAITNLVQNSIIHNPDGCHILVQTTLSPDQQHACLIIADNGRGIAKHLLPDLLELPYSSKRNTPVHNGHGLGLPMVARIAAAHHGRLQLSSDTGKGMTAEICLPLSSQPE
ncbi:sensor histidine kinase [Brevibacillus sp. 179-C9.3 HS]|uniref:sensor histidine kinase n=1 Tax=unclassified Brevibacillus TaxID=2684853 RepID=UPI0039A1B956